MPIVRFGSLALGMVVLGGCPERPGRASEPKEAEDAETPSETKAADLGAPVVPEQKTSSSPAK